MGILKHPKTFQALLVAISLGVSALCGGCSLKVGASSPWVGYAFVQGPLQPEVSAFPRNSFQEPMPGDFIRITTFNVHHGENVDGIVNALLRDAALSRSSLIFLQEVRSYPGEGSSRASRIATQLGMAYVYAPAKEVKGGTHGLAILSQFPLENVAIMELPAGELIVNNERRIAVSADILLNGIRIHLVNVHLDTRLNPAERIQQLRPAVIDAPREIILGGDFNTNPMVWAFNTVPVLPLAISGGTDQAPILDDYLRGLQMDAPTAGFGPTVDFPVLSPRLDSFYLRGLGSGDGAVERDVAVSDHWPLWLDVRLPH